jgi:hypothetical protein
VTVLGGLAEFERELIRTRTSERPDLLVDKAQVMFVENCVQKLRINEARIDLLVELVDDMLGRVLGAPIPCQPLVCLNDQFSLQFTGFAFFEQVINFAQTGSPWRSSLSVAKQMRTFDLKQLAACRRGSTTSCRITQRARQEEF